MEFNDVRLQYEQLSSEIDAAATRLFSSGRYILGPVLETFEEEFARYAQCSSGIGVASGTDAIRIALAAAGVRAGDEVLVPAVSAAATAMAVTQLQAVPVFVDIDAEDFTMDPADAMEKRSSRTKAAVPVHLYGMPARLKELSVLGVPLIEDACQAHGSEAAWGRCGSFGVAAAFSFYPTKNLGGYGDGGMITTSDRTIAERAKLLRNYGQRENYSSEMLGDNSRLDDLQAAILRVKLKKLDAWNERRGAIAETYRKAFAELPVALQRERARSRSNCHLFVVATPERDALRQHLLSHGIPTAIHYPFPLPRQKAFAELRVRPAACPNADRFCSQVLSLPIHASLADHEVARVAATVQSFFASATGHRTLGP